MAFTQKSSSTIQRLEGELPSIPEVAGANLREWWSEATAVLDRVRDKIDDIDAATSDTSEAAATSSDNAKLRPREIKAALGIEGDAVGTLNEQDIVNKGLDSGTFI